MTYGIDYEIEFKPDFEPEEWYHKTVDAVLEAEGCPYEAEVNLLITDDEAIREINREQRDIDSPTDVLSFPMVQYDVPGDFSKLEEADDCFNMESGELLLGDIVISADRIKEQALEYGHSELREFTFLIAHSMLHLIGYDHIKDEDRELMEERQRRVMDILGIFR